ncbi:MAG: ornithine cyclodeaminase family protein [Caldilineaceae bacterium]
MLILTHADVVAVLTMEMALAAAERAFQALALGAVTMPQRLATSIAPHSALQLAMPAYLQGDESEGDALAIKVVSVYPQNPARTGLPFVQGSLLLFDAATGALLALMDAEYLTAMRTGAAAGVATRLLARPESSTLLQFGAGALAPALVAAVCAVRPIQRVLVVSRTGVKDAALCAQIAATHGVEAISVPSEMWPIRHALKQADIITTATPGDSPLFEGTWLQPGTHINAMGAYRPDLCELDGAAVAQAQIYVDSIEAALAEAGDILKAIEVGALRAYQVRVELGELLQGSNRGRLLPSDITLFKSVGLAVQDVATAAAVYTAAAAAGLGTKVSLRES